MVHLNSPRDLNIKVLIDAVQNTSEHNWIDKTQSNQQYKLGFSLKRSIFGLKLNGKLK